MAQVEKINYCNNKEESTSFEVKQSARGLSYEEPLLYEQSRKGASGADIVKADIDSSLLGQVELRKNIGLPEVSESEVVRHFVRLSTMNYSIDSGIFPLGSCTMKHNPRLNEKLARLTGFANIHPLQPTQTVQGALSLMYDLQNWLKELSGLDAVTLNPAAGAHGEYAGVKAIAAAHKAKGNTHKNVILVPDSAHGTNPATAAFCGFKVRQIDTCKSGERKGKVDLASLDAALQDDVAGIMLTNPNTCGLYESDAHIIAEKIHSVGGYFYCDGANFNAIVGKVRPADFGVDVMHFNLHKTFSTPHGGGGPGCGPIAVCKDLEPYLPVPLVVKNNDGSFGLTEKSESSFGRLKSFNGQFGMFVRALSYMLSHGGDGLQRVAEDAVINANYIKARLKDYYNIPFDEHCMHEFLMNDRLQRDAGVTTMDIAKTMIEYGIHPMTVFFPLVVQNAMLIEPTETESKTSLDYLVDTLIKIANEAKSCPDDLHQNPVSTPRRRLDEVRAVKDLNLKFGNDIQ